MNATEELKQRQTFMAKRHFQSLDLCL